MDNCIRGACLESHHLKASGSSLDVEKARAEALWTHLVEELVRRTQESMIGGAHTGTLGFTVTWLGEFARKLRVVSIAGGTCTEAP